MKSFTVWVNPRLLRLTPVLAFLLGPGAVAQPGDEPVCGRTLAEMLASMKKAIQTRTGFRKHPDSVSPFELTVGQSVVLDPSAFEGRAKIMKKLKGPVRVTVAGLRKITAGDGKSDTVAELSLPDGKKVFLPIFDLRGKIFSTEDYAEHAPFVAGEYLQMGNDFYPKVAAIDRDSGETINLEKPYLVKFLGVADDHHYLVELEVKNHQMKGALEVPKEAVSGLGHGTGEALRDSLKDLLNLKLNFTRNEKVRYRDANGDLHCGTFLRTRQNAAQIRDAAGSNVFVPVAEVFKVTAPDNSATADLAGLSEFVYEGKNAWTSHTELPLVQRRSLRDVLNGAAKISSLPDFSQLDSRARLATLEGYIQANMPWTESALTAETAGLGNVNALLCAGVGVCRHHAPLLAQVLKEAGYTVRIMKYAPTDATAHMSGADKARKIDIVTKLEG